MNAFKVFEDELAASVKRFDAMDNDEFVAALTRMMVDDGMSGPVTISEALVSMMQRGSIEAAAALTVVLKSSEDADGYPKMYKTWVEAMAALMRRSDDVRAGAIQAALESMISEIKAARGE